MTPAQIANLFKKSAESRMTLFLDTLRETREVYGLADEEGWALLGHASFDAENDPDILPLFHHRGVAEAFRKGAGFAEMQVEKMTASELAAWLEELEAEGTLVSLLPNPDMEGIVIEASELLQVLREFGMPTL